MTTIETRCFDATRRYYAAWTGVDPDVFDQPGVHTVFSDDRDRVQTGHSSRMDLYALVLEGTTIVSYGKRLADRIDEVASAFEAAANASDAVNRVRELLGRGGRSIKFAMAGVPDSLDTSAATMLHPEDYPAYERFFRQMHGRGAVDHWLEEYFREMAEDGFCWGMWADGQIVCASDAPSIPYLADEITEQGINTLRVYRGEGYGSVVAGAMARHLLSEGRVPIWSCGVDNTASIRTAERIGYRRFADAITATMPEG